jgi:hypothetical protein
MAVRYQAVLYGGGRMDRNALRIAENKRSPHLVTSHPHNLHGSPSAGCAFSWATHSSKAPRRAAALASVCGAGGDLAEAVAHEWRTGRGEVLKARPT